MAKVKFIPESQRLLVLPDEKQDIRTRSGIIIPGKTEDDKPSTGVVIVAGTGEKDRPMKYKNGDVVLYSNYAGIEVNLDLTGEGVKEYKVMNQLDIMGIIIREDENIC